MIKITLSGLVFFPKAIYNGTVSHRFDVRFDWGMRNLPIVASAMHSRIRTAIVKTKFLGPSQDVLRALIIVLATTSVRCCEAAQMRRTVSSVTLTAPFCMGNNVEFIVGVAFSPINIKCEGSLVGFNWIDFDGSSSVYVGYDVVIGRKRGLK